MTTTPAFHVGDPYIKVDQGFARLPGAGYQALHPELKDVNPEDYPDIHKMAILADVAPYSREYQVLPSCLPQNPSRARAETAAAPAEPEDDPGFAEIDDDEPIEEIEELDDAA